MHVVCTYLNPQTMMPTGNSLAKTFTSPDEFTKFYNICKADPCVVINVMTYDPHAKAALKSVYDHTLLKLSRNSYEQ